MRLRLDTHTHTHTKQNVSPSSRRGVGRLDWGSNSVFSYTAIAFCFLSVSTLCNIATTDVFLYCVTSHNWYSLVNIDTELSDVDSMMVRADFLVTGL